MTIRGRLHKKEYGRPTVVERSNASIRWIVDEDEVEGSNPRHARLSFDCSMNQEQRSFFLTFSRQEKRSVDARFSSSKAADRIGLRNVSPSKTASASEIKGKKMRRRNSSI